METSFSIQLCINQKVSKCSFFNIFIFLINSVILQLLFGKSESKVLRHFNSVSPLIAKLTILIGRVDIVKDRKLWTNEESEMFDLNVANIISKKELMMKDHSSKPVVMFPSSESGDGVDGCNIETCKDETSS